ncbi:MAG: TonB-dependent receptor [Prevotellaceae bacterium]|nr:TonB-dependent receptor [Prevotellaceae bacterium]
MITRNVIILFLNILSVNMLFGQLTQNVRGVVRDKSSGAPLEHATVAIIGTQPLMGATADSLGQFLVRNVPLGRYDIQAGFAGYEPLVVKEVLLSASKETCFEILMTEKLNALDEIVITPAVNKSQPLNAMALGSARMFSVEETGRYAGGFDDPARLASAFAGVTGSIGNNGIVVRGNSPKFLQWRLEGAEIPNPNHFAEVTAFGGGALTAFSSHLLGNSDFFTGAFPAEYGNALSGVFDMNLRSGNSRKRESAFQFGAVGIDFASEGPFSRESNSSYIFNYRYSTLALLASILPKNAGGVRYQDFSFKLNFPTRRAGVFSVWGIGLIDRSGQEAKTDSLQWTYTADRDRAVQKQYTAAFGVSHSIPVRNGARLKTSLAATVNSLEFITDRTDGNLQFRPESTVGNTGWNFILSSFLNKKFSARHTNRTGIRITGMKYDLLLQNADAQGLQTLTDESGTSALLSAWSSSMFNLSDKWTLNIGLNTLLFSLNNRFAAEPRAGVRWKFMPGHSVGLSYGLHSRLEMLYYYFTKSADGKMPNRNMDFTRAHHLAASYSWNISGDYRLLAEPYVQRLFSVPVVAGSSFSFINLQRDWFVADRLENAGKGFNCGLDVTFEKYMSQGYYYMLTASLFDSRYMGGDRVWRSTRYNRSYVFNLLAGKEWLTGRRRQNPFSASIRLSYQGGDRHSPVSLKASQEAKEIVYDESRAFSEQHPPSFLCHFTVSYKINRQNLSHEFSLKAINATMNKEYLGYRYNLKTRQADLEHEFIMIPNVSYKIEF